MTERTPNPPEDKLKRWEDDILNERENVDVVLDCAWKNGYRAGADQELEACVWWLRDELRAPTEWSTGLRAARRPKPPSLAEQALERINKIQGNKKMWQLDELDVVRAALKRLQKLERGDD